MINDDITVEKPIDDYYAELDKRLQGLKSQLGTDADWMPSTYEKYMTGQHQVAGSLQRNVREYYNDFKLLRADTQVRSTALLPAGSWLTTEAAQEWCSSCVGQPAVRSMIRLSENCPSTAGACGWHAPILLVAMPGLPTSSQASRCLWALTPHVASQGRPPLSPLFCRDTFHFDPAPSHSGQVYYPVPNEVYRDEWDDVQVTDPMEFTHCRYTPVVTEVRARGRSGPTRAAGVARWLATRVQGCLTRGGGLKEKFATCVTVVQGREAGRSDYKAFALTVLAACQPGTH